LRPIAPTYAAHGQALCGDHAAMERAYDQAHALLDTSDDDPAESPPGPWFDDTWIDLRRAWSLAALGEGRRAGQSFLETVADLPPRYRRGRGVWLARTALTLAGDREVEHAASLGLDAPAIGRDRFGPHPHRTRETGRHAHTVAIRIRRGRFP
jgi:hypothetical protein